MEIRSNKILSFSDLEIGFVSRKFRRILLPPLKGTANRGELIAVIGKNGIGKSTLLRTITGLQHFISGIMTIEGKSVIEYPKIQLASQVGYISTEIVKVSNMRVYDLVSLGRFPYTNWLGKISDADEKAINEAIIKTGMTGFRERPVTELSDGERQKAMIAMLLAQDTNLLVMDEPTAFLDISSKFEIIHLMHELTRTRDKTIVFSTHDLSVAVSQADKIWLLKEQGLLEGAPEDLVLEGSFKTLFDESKVLFNSSDGTFMIRNEQKGQVKVWGEGDQKYWTEKALIRAGYTITDSKSTFEVQTPSKQCTQWKILTPDATMEFNSVYELISWIREEHFIY
jgi:iron complex transport system ATP-binding protein